MGTEILHPHDCLIDRLRVAPAVFPRRKSKKRVPQSEPLISKKSSSDDLKSGRSFDMGRGESVDMKKRNDFLKKKSFLSPVTVRCDVYAGSACSLSPSPSSLPLPSFFKKKEDLAIFQDSATKDLRRLLRLD
ncbi:hypothetical protein HHK36_022854 [Tetracentron sinense]|uniref:Uncharacterized protein n=1 Tax=Tetracentron sinense TaxID=13715 RepID=A0A834YVM5_TETSI|nr:hypothetical protein HHK36_022854 [Tetracentron sinense]